MFDANNEELLDAKITKKIYPRTNNSQILEFVVEKDPHLFMVKNKIIIRGAIEIDNKYIVDNNWVSKLFSILTIELDSQIITKNNTRYIPV